MAAGHNVIDLAKIYPAPWHSRVAAVDRGVDLSGVRPGQEGFSGGLRV